MNIAVCGNHRVPYCTEQELVWTFQSMGHRVIPFQEDASTTDGMLHLCRQGGISLFVYVHTHGWKTPGNLSFESLLEQLRFFGVTTVSFHLDRYWGLEKGDQRESRVGNHAFWKSEYVFTADGGNDELFQARGVNHHWLPPGVAARHCFIGTKQPQFAADVIFVGARNYHPEYPFRSQLVDWLSATYGNRFRRYNGDCGGVVREERLNDLYASAKVVVGDSCFAGAPYYWSDRVPETLGRGGFLLHPKTPGLDIEGLVTFEPGNLLQLKTLIDYYLENEESRQALSLKALNDVREHHTYTNRMQTLLKVIGVLPS